MAILPMIIEGPSIGLPDLRTIASQIKWSLIQSSKPSEERLSQVLDQYHLSNVGPVRNLNNSYRNENWIIRTSAGKKVIKRYKPNLEFEQILHEHSVLDHLAQKGFAAPRLRKNACGDTITSFEGRYYGIFDCLEGYYHPEDYHFLPHRDRFFQKKMGKTLGELHVALCHFVPKGRNLFGFESINGKRYWNLDWYLSRMDTCKEAARKLPIYKDDPIGKAFFEQASWIEERFCELDSILEKANLTRSVIHGDYGLYNLFFKPNCPTVVLDFELARTDWCLIDLVTAMKNAGWKKNRLNFLAMKDVVEGYSATSPISKEEIRMIPEVWEYLSLRKAIISSSLLFERKQSRYLNEANQSLQRALWVKDQSRQLASLA